jgi:hypothetical protein
VREEVDPDGSVQAHYGEAEHLAVNITRVATVGASQISRAADIRRLYNRQRNALCEGWPSRWDAGVPRGLTSPFGLTMKTATLVWLVPVVLLGACGRTSTNDAATPAAVTPAAATRQTQIPLLPTPPSDLPANASQADAVTYAWQQFVALNWPALAAARGVPDTTKTIGQPGNIVWHTWKTPDEIFYPGGQAPPPWNQYGGQLPPQCVSTGATSTSFVLQRTSKVPGNIDNAAIQAAKEAVGGTLTDQHGNLARYEVRMNQAIFNTIVGSQLYTIQGQDNAFEISFAAGVMEVKAAWRQMTSADPPSVMGRYYTETAWIYTPPFGNSPAVCVKGTVGLVGLHITQKTPTLPQWTWATFEQIDNVPPPASNYSGTLSFNNPTCPPLSCPPNQSTEKNGVPTAVPTQVTRVVPIGQAAAAANASWQQALSQAVTGSPFQYYQLIDVQWPQTPTRFPVGNPTPGQLANTTMETYLTESSCIHCHFTARTQSGKLSSDYSFMLAEAQSSTPPRTTR